MTRIQVPSRLCPHCAQSFTPGRRNQRFCDALCKRWFNRRLVFDLKEWIVAREVASAS